MAVKGEKNGRGEKRRELRTVTCRTAVLRVWKKDDGVLKGMESLLEK